MYKLIIWFFLTFCLLTSCNTEEINRVRNMTINDIKLDTISDGVYHGNFTYGGFTYVTETVVKNHKIENINVIQNRKSKFAKKAEGVIPKILQGQTLKVDVVSGATTTSKAILKAIENSLPTQISK